MILDGNIRVLGICLYFRAGPREWDPKPSWSEWDSIKVLAPHLREPIALVFGDDSLQLSEEVALPVGGLRRAIGEIRAFLDRGTDQLPFTYMFKVEYLELDGRRSPIDDGFVTGRSSGFHLVGDPDHSCTIEAGLDVCCLGRRRTGPDGRPQNAGWRDLREETEIQTVEWGRIEIRKDRSMAGLREMLADLDGFLATLTEATVSRRIG